MTERADLNDSIVTLHSVQGETVVQFRIVQGMQDCCLSCMGVGGIWYERECVPRESNWWYEYVCFWNSYCV